MTIYARKRRQAVVACLTFFGLGAVANSHGAQALALVLLGIGVAAIACVARRPRLSADARGVTVANLLRTFRIPWSDISGFGFGWGGTVSCLQIHRRDGGTVNAWVVADSGPNAYAPERLQEIVADLRERLAATGTVAHGEVAPVAAVEGRPRSKPFVGALPHAMWVLVCGFLLVFGAVTSWHAWKDLPHTYSRLRSQGVPAAARFVGCDVVDLRTHRCQLTLTYQGTTRTWKYPQDYLQFQNLPVGSAVPVLVDPEHPATVYTVHDVDSGWDAGFGGLAVFGAALAVLGALGLVFSVWLLRLKSAARRTGEGRTDSLEPAATE
jgi:hypothetical protein